MSRSEAERACFGLRDADARALFERDPERYLERFELSAAERDAIVAGDVGALLSHDLLYGALDALGRQFGYTNEAYVRRLRAGAGLPVCEEQIETLRRRAAARRRE